MAAPDGHAKNYSIFMREGGAYDSTPLYDVLSVWPYVGKRRGQLHLRDVRLAMALRGKSVHYDIFGIRARHWHALALKNGGPAIWSAMLNMVEGVEAALADVESFLPRSFPERIWNPIAEGMKDQAKQFLEEASALVRTS